MSIRYDDVRRWDAQAIERAAANLQDRKDQLIGLQDELDDARRLPNWQGLAGQTARTSLETTRNNAEILVAELAAVERALRNAADDVEVLKTRVANNDSLANTYQFRIAPDGAIVDVRPADPAPTSQFEAEELREIRRHRENIRQQLEQETSAILTTANNIDATLARVMQLALDRKITDHDATTLAGASKGGDLDAQVVYLEQALRDAGLLTGPPVTGAYRRWLENAALRGVPVDTIIQIASEHHLTPEDFAILDGLEEIREDADGDGIFKSFYLLPTNISGADAAKAVRMTYVVNAGTDYGAHGQPTDFPPTPYGSEELSRIIARQQANYWTYTSDVWFVHTNGGRLVTTPNGILMGLGGNFIQDLYSQRGGTTYGDIFMLNIDDPPDAAEQLRTVVRSGYAWYETDQGITPGTLDLDRLLHHEERHSQQWAREGYLGRIASYAWERMTGGNQTEEDAGLSDGGY